MRVRKSVFGSKQERKLYHALESTWAEKFDMYLSLPFANIIDIKDAKIDQKEKDFLLKTSIDYTLCEKSTAKPIMSIDFDGLGRGFSHGDEYVLPPVRTVKKVKDPYRKLKFDLKLRLAREVLYPYIIVSSEESELFSKDFELTIVDGLIGKSLARERFDELLREKSDELTHDDCVQDWAVGLEVQADLESNPIARKAAILKGEIWRKGICESMGFRFLEDPPAPVLKSSDDLETLKKRIRALNSPFTKVGCEVTFVIKNHQREFSSKVFVRNFGSVSTSLALDIATLLAAKKTLVWWNI